MYYKNLEEEKMEFYCLICPHSEFFADKPLDFWICFKADPNLTGGQLTMGNGSELSKDFKPYWCPLLTKEEKEEIAIAESDEGF